MAALLQPSPASRDKHKAANRATKILVSFGSSKMFLVPISMIALSAQFVVRVADVVPKFDIARGCRLDSAQAFDPSAGLNETIKKCVADEQGAMEQLQKQWPQFLEADKTQCIGETQIGGTASYVDLLTCLQLAKDASQLPK
jgi:hypothetical protein